MKPKIQNTIWIISIIMGFFIIGILMSSIANALEFKVNTNYCNWINGNYQSCNISVGFHSSTNSTLYSGYLCSYTDYYSNGTRLTAYANMTETGNTSIYNYNFTGRGALGLYNSIVNCTSNIENATSFNSYWVVSELASRSIANISDYSKIINDTTIRIETNTIDTKNILFNGTLQSLIWSYSGSRNLTYFDYKTQGIYVWNSSERNLTYIDWTTAGANVWNSSTRTLTSYGTLISDIWGFASRNLTYINWQNSSLYIWNSTDRNLTFTADVTNYPAIQTWVWNYTTKTLNIWNETSEDLIYQCLKESNCAGWWINNTLTTMNNTLNSWNNAITKSYINIYGTEYEPLENASIFAQVLNSTGSYTNSSCNISMIYTNLTFFVNNSNLSFMPSSRSVYRYNFITPNITGDIAVQVYCGNPVIAEGISKIHVAPWAYTINVINSTRFNELKNLFACDTITGYNNIICERLNKIIDTTNTTLFTLKVNSKKYYMEIYSQPSTNIDYPYSYKLYIRGNGADSNPQIFIKVPINSSSDALIRNENGDLQSFSFTTDAMNQGFLYFYTTGLGCTIGEITSHSECPSKQYQLFLKNPLYYENKTSEIKPQSYLDLTLERFATTERKMLPEYNFKGYLLLGLSILGGIILLLAVIFGIMFLFFWTFEERLEIKKKLIGWKYKKKYLKNEEGETE